MSRRFWIGTPKGQNTTADTFFDTSRVTTYQVNTSAPTTYPSFFDTFYDTDVPTEYIISTTYDVSTAYVSSFFYGVNTSRPTADTRITQYYYPGIQTLYSRNTTTSYITNYTYPVNTNVVVVDDVYAPATRNTTLFGRLRSQYTIHRLFLVPRSIQDLQYLQRTLIQRLLHIRLVLVVVITMILLVI